MDPRVEAVLADYDLRAEREFALVQGLSDEQFRARRDELLLHLGRDSAQLLSILVKAQGARTIVEVGASYG